MNKQRQLNIRIDEKIYQIVKNKCKEEFGIGITPLIKIFLKTFATQKGVGFFVGDLDLQKIIYDWLRKKYLEKGRQGCAPLAGPNLDELYKL